MLAALLEAGCPANAPDSHGVYPLHYAANESREPLPTGERGRKRERVRGMGGMRGVGERGQREGGGGYSDQY